MRQGTETKNTATARRIFPAAHPFLQMGALFIMLLALIHTASAETPVSARYLGISGDTIRLQLTISNPSPQSLILEQYLPPGTRILATSPAAKQINSNSGVVKWLFKGVSPGNINVTMRVSPASAASRVSGTLRYRLPGGGGMTELRIPH